MITKIDHIGIAVRSIENSLPLYTETLQLDFEGIEIVDSEKVRVAFIKIGSSRIELLEPTSKDSAIAKFIQKRGEGIHHIALGTDSIDNRIQHIKDHGIQMIHEQAKPGANGSMVAFLHPKSTGNILYELCEKNN